MRVDTIGIGQRGATTVSGQTRVGLDEATLQRVAETTGGQYFYASDANQLTDVYRELGSQISWIEQRTEVSAMASGLGALFFVMAGLLGRAGSAALP